MLSWRNRNHCLPLTLALNQVTQPVASRVAVRGVVRSISPSTPAKTWTDDEPVSEKSPDYARLNRYAATSSRD